MLGIVIVFYHPCFELRRRLRTHPAILGDLRVVLNRGLEIASEIGVGFAEDRKQNHEFLIRLLPLGRIGLVTERRLQLCPAVITEVQPSRFAVFKQVCATFSLRFIEVSIMVERRLLPAIDVNAQRVIGWVLAFGVEDGGSKQETT